MKIGKIIITAIIFFTLFLNIISLSFAINYQNTHGKYNRALISSAGNDILKLKEVCQNVNQPAEERLFYKKIITWSFMAIMISSAIILMEFVLAKSRIVLFSSRDWKYLRIITFTVFLSAFIFVYTPLVMEDNSYLVQCLKIYT